MLAGCAGLASPFRVCRYDPSMRGEIGRDCGVFPQNLQQREKLRLVLPSRGEPDFPPLNRSATRYVGVA